MIAARRRPSPSAGVADDREDRDVWTTPSSPPSSQLARGARNPAMNTGASGGGARKNWLSSRLISSWPPIAMITAVIATIVATGIRNAMAISERGRARRSPSEVERAECASERRRMLGRARAGSPGGLGGADSPRPGGAAWRARRRGFASSGRGLAARRRRARLRGAVAAARFGASGALGAGHGASRSGAVSSHRSANRSDRRRASGAEVAAVKRRVIRVVSRRDNRAASARW